MFTTKNLRLSRRALLQTTIPAGILAIVGWPTSAVRAIPNEPAGEGDAGGGTTGTNDVKLLFSGPADICDTWGKLHFGATPMHKIRDCQHPGFSLACCQPREDGSWDVYGQTFTRDEKGGLFDQQNQWKLIHAITQDGSTFENVETVYESARGPWTDHLGLAYNPDAQEFLALKLLIDDNGFGYRAYFSPDGLHWTEHAANPLFYDCDSLGLFWSQKARRYVCTNKTLQPYLKHIQDHGGSHPQNNNDALRDRRVIAIRSSSDGRTWEPAESMMDVWNRLGSYKPLPDHLMAVPDSDDPPDMEFYRGIGFWYHDRSFLVVLNYAASAVMPLKHGPQLDTEWWVSRDGLRWERPYRHTNALGDAFPGAVCITHNPMLIDGHILFHFGDRLLGMKQDRISYVGARANAEFSTALFTMPGCDLAVNAAVPSPDRGFARNQAYLMAELRTELGETIPGYEREKCVIENRDEIAIPLLWNGRSARELAGQTVQLRFSIRSANVYAVTTLA